MSATLDLLLFNGFNAGAMHAFLDPFRAANYLTGQAHYTWRFTGLTTEPVTASNGLQVLPEAAFTPKDRPDILVLNASWSVEQYFRAPILRLIQNAHRQGTTLCGLDTSAFLMARAGLLKGKAAAVHYEHIAAFRELFPDTQMGEDLFVMEDRLMTACGGAAGTDMALHLIRAHHGLDIANAAARYIFHDRLRPGQEGQLSTRAEPVGMSAPDDLRAAISLMESTLETPLTLDALANRLDISPRQLARIFRKHTGVSPQRYYLDVRLDRARSLITQTDLPVLEVALASGFNGPSQFSRAYRDRFKTTPSQDRTEGRVPFHFRSFPSHQGVG